MSKRIVNPDKCYRVEQRIPRVKITKDGKEKPMGFGWIPIGRKGFETEQEAEKFKQRAEKSGKVNMGNYYAVIGSKLRIKKVPYYITKC